MLRESYTARPLSSREDADDVDGGGERARGRRGSNNGIRGKRDARRTSCTWPTSPLELPDIARERDIQRVSAECEAKGGATTATMTEEASRTSHLARDGRFAECSFEKWKTRNTREEFRRG